MDKRVGRLRHLSHWDAEDVVAWESGGKTIARRNLFWSVVIVHLGYSIWALWPVMALFMPKDVYGFSAGDKLLLGMTATLVGACLRPAYAIATAIFGGRTLAIFSALMLLIPTVGAMVLLAHPGLPLWPYLVCAALTGMGGGNFAASASNANSFYPHRLKGVALGIAGGIGNLGVPAIQIVGLIVIATAGDGRPYWVCGLYLVLLITAGVGAAVFMNNVAQHRVELGGFARSWRRWPPRATPGSSRCSTSVVTARSSASHSRSPRYCRPVSSPAGKACPRPRCTLPNWRSSGPCWVRWRASTVAGWPTASAGGASR